MGLEKIAWSEINHKWNLFLNSKPPLPIFYQGGFEIECNISDGLSLNLFSKTANRVLLRVKSQKCRDIPKLYKIISKIDWKAYLKRTQVNWSITSSESRLFNTKKIQNACEDALIKYFNANQLPRPIKENAKNYNIQNIFIRFEEDLLTISIDTSGELLHIRGGDAYRGHASIRSTIASCLLWKTLDHQQSYSLIDPMCGTGTFLKEALNFYELSNRSFPFYDWYEFSGFKQIDKTLAYESLIGFDNDQNIINKNKNKKDKIIYDQKDIFTDKYSEIKNAIVICNPPYGKRVKIESPREEYFQNLVDSIQNKLNPCKLGMIIPSDIKIKQNSEIIRIFNSGIWLNYHLF